MEQKNNYKITAVIFNGNVTTSVKAKNMAQAIADACKKLRCQPEQIIGIDCELKLKKNHGNTKK